MTRSALFLFLAAALSAGLVACIIDPLPPGPNCPQDGGGGSCAGSDPPAGGADAGEAGL